MNLFRTYKMRLYSLNRVDLKECSASVMVKYVPITIENVKWVNGLKGEQQVKEFCKHIKKRDFGYYAMIDEKVVGYGWRKNKESDDTFYIINDGCYLSSFYVDSEFRGKNIYPSLITNLVKQSEEQRFYIAAYDTNVSSLRGLEKTGFLFLRQDTIFRLLKVTLNKKLLKK